MFCFHYLAEQQESHPPVDPSAVFVLWYLFLRSAWWPCWWALTSVVPALCSSWLCDCSFSVHWECCQSLCSKYWRLMIDVGVWCSWWYVAFFFWRLCGWKRLIQQRNSVVDVFLGKWGRRLWWCSFAFCSCRDGWRCYFVTKRLILESHFSC